MDSISPPDPYKILGVAKDAKLLEIRSAHRKLALKCHPDRVEDETLKRVKQVEFQQVQQAYELLSDDSRRSQYDEKVWVFEFRKKLKHIALCRASPKPYRFEYKLGTGGPTSYERSISIPELSVRATVAPKLHENVPDGRVRDARKRSTSYEMAGDGDQKQRSEERAERAPREYATQRKTDIKLPSTERYAEDQLRVERIIESLSKPISELPRPQPSLKVYPRSQSTEEVIVPGQDVPSRRVRRGRGARQVVGVNGSDDPNDPDFFVRDIEIRSRSGSPNLARCRLDSQCEVPLLVSEHWARENDKWPEVSSDFHDPGMQSVSGHKIKVNGILRNMVFNLKGSTVTYRRDVYVCQQLDFWADMVFGARFIAEQFPILFSKAKKMFAGIFGFRKEKTEEKVRGKALQDEADRQAAEQERKRRAKKEREAREKEEARNRAGEEHQRRQTGQ